MKGDTIKLLSDDDDMPKRGALLEHSQDTCGPELCFFSHDVVACNALPKLLFVVGALVALDPCSSSGAVRERIVALHGQ